jgi:hypothetical protein
MPIRFRLKPGHGKHYASVDGKKTVLRPGDVICCEPAELGGAIGKFEQLDPDPPPAAPEIGLCVVNRDDGLCDVVNEATGEKINDAPMTPEEASSLTDKFEDDAEPSGAYDEEDE